jgi:1,4-alpha-glucan branching enzyme
MENILSSLYPFRTVRRRHNFYQQAYLSCKKPCEPAYELHYSKENSGNTLKKEALMNGKKQKPTRKKVLLSLHAPQAKTVFLAGDFNDWNPGKHGLKKGKYGAWEKTLILPPPHL